MGRESSGPLGGVVTAGGAIRFRALEEERVSQETVRVIGMAGAVIVLAGLAAWLGLAHGCEGPRDGTIVAGRITLAPELADRLSETDVLYVIVRRAEGPRRPLAVKRIDSPRFPVDFAVTQDDVMMRGTELKGMVEVVARVDKDGSAGPPQAGDMEGAFERNPTLVGGRDVEIQIDTIY